MRERTRSRGPGQPHRPNLFLVSPNYSPCPNDATKPDITARATSGLNGLSLPLDFEASWFCRPNTLKTLRVRRLSASPNCSTRSREPLSIFRNRIVSRQIGPPCEFDGKVEITYLRISVHLGR